MKTPRDVHARERLRRAQADEARAVAEVYGAEHRVAATQAAADQATDDLGKAQAALIDVSGLDRSAALLGMSKADLRKALRSEPSSRTATD
jgi:hypothetical protein